MFMHRYTVYVCVCVYPYLFPSPTLDMSSQIPCPSFPWPQHLRSGPVPQGKLIITLPKGMEDHWNLF